MGKNRPPELDGTSKDLDEKVVTPLTDDEAPSSHAHQFFEVNSGKGKSTMIRKKKRRERARLQTRLQMQTERRRQK
jgi:hypothetical protein